MTLLKLLAAGTLGYLAWRAWQRLEQHRHTIPLHDTGGHTPPHGDPILAGERIDIPPAPRAGVQSSRGFGEA